MVSDRVVLFSTVAVLNVKSFVLLSVSVQIHLRETNHLIYVLVFSTIVVSVLASGCQMVS